MFMYVYWGVGWGGLLSVFPHKHIVKKSICSFVYYCIPAVCQYFLGDEDVTVKRAWELLLHRDWFNHPSISNTY